MAERTDTYTVVQAGQDFIPLPATVESITSITVNGATKTFNEHIYASTPTPGYDFYWTEDHLGVFTYGWIIGNPDLGLHLNKGDVVVITWTPRNTNVVLIDDPDVQIDDGGTGSGGIVPPFDSTDGGSTSTGGSESEIWESITEERYVRTEDGAQAIGEEMLVQFGNRDALNLTFEIDDTSLADLEIDPGHRIRITIPRFEIDEDVLVTNISSEWVAASRDFMRHTVTCASIDPTSGRPHGLLGNGATEYLEKLSKQSRIGESAVDQITSAGPDGSGTGIGEVVLTLLDTSSTVSVATDVLSNHPELAIKTGLAAVPLEWSFNVKTAPTGSSLVVDVYYSTDKTTWTSIFTGSPSIQPSIAAGSKYNDGTSFSAASVPKGAFFRFDYVQVGSSVSGGGVTLEIRFRLA